MFCAVPPPLPARRLAQQSLLDGLIGVNDIRVAEIERCWLGPRWGLFATHHSTCVHWLLMVVCPSEHRSGAYNRSQTINMNKIRILLKPDFTDLGPIGFANHTMEV